MAWRRNLEFRPPKWLSGAEKGVCFQDCAYFGSSVGMVSAGAAAGIPVGVTVGVGPRVAVAVGVGGGPGGPCWMQYSGRRVLHRDVEKNIHWPSMNVLTPIVPVSLASLEPQSTQCTTPIDVPPMLFVPVQTTPEGGEALFSSLLRGKVRFDPIKSLILRQPAYHPVARRVSSPS